MVSKLQKQVIRSKQKGNQKMKKDLSTFTDSQINLEICIRKEGEGGFIEPGLLDYSLDELTKELQKRNKRQ